jgi:fucose permease
VATSTETLRMPAVWLSIAVFFLYAGIELTAGQWSFSLFTESRGVSVATAGLWVGMYWGTFTAGRIVYGIIGNRLRVVTTLRASMIGAILASLLIWWNMSNILSFIGLAGLGFALAPVFPLLVTETPRRLGLHNAGNAIGFQVGAAGLGIAALPGFVGVLATWTGLEIVGPFLAAACTVTYVLYELLPDSAS